MNEKEITIRSANYKQRLEMKQKDGLDRVKRTIDKGMSKEYRKNDTGYTNRLDMLAMNKFREGREYVLEKWKMEARNQKSDLDFEHFEKRYEAYMSAFVRRLNLMLKLSARDKEGSRERIDTVVSTDTEYLRMMEFAFPYLESFDASYVLNTAFEAFDPAQKDMLQDQLDAMFESCFPGDQFKLIDKIYGGGKLDSADYLLIRSEFQYAVKNGVAYGRLEKNKKYANPRMTTAAMVLQSLSGPQRMNMLRPMMEEEFMPNEMKSMVHFGYVSIGEARMLVGTKIKELEKGTNKKLLEAYTNLQTYLSDNKDQIYQSIKDLKKYSEEKAEALINHMTGHYNRIERNASPKGVVGLYLLGNGALTAGSNFVVALLTGGNFANPGLWAGVAMVGAGLEMTRGAGGMLPTTGEILGKVTKDRKEVKIDAMDKRKARVMDKFGSDPDLAQFFYTYAQNIDKAYDGLPNTYEGGIDLSKVITLTKAEKDKGETRETKITEICKKTGLNRKQLESKLRDWAQTISDPINGAGRKGWRSQREFLEKTDKENAALLGMADSLSKKNPPEYINTDIAKKEEKPKDPEPKPE